MIGPGPMERQSQRHFALIFLLGLAIMSPQLFHLSRKGPPPAPLDDDAQLVLVGQQHPHLIFQPIPINSAEAEEFAVIPGIGPELSRRIVAYRSEHGPFQSLEGLARVAGIGPKKMASLKTYCRLSSP